MEHLQTTIKFGMYQVVLFLCRQTVRLITCFCYKTLLFPGTLLDIFVDFISTFIGALLWKFRMSIIHPVTFKSNILYYKRFFKFSECMVFTRNFHNHLTIT